MSSSEGSHGDFSGGTSDVPAGRVTLPQQFAQATGTDAIRAFLIADIRGYTTFTSRYGDEAASALVRRFEDIARHVVHAAGGRVVELRGDEVLAEFASARAALLAATNLVASCIQETVGNTHLPPLPVGVGVDAGEAIAYADGYRGAALNMAARLCAKAQAGEVLATETATHLAGQATGLRYGRHQRMQLKGLAEPAPVVEVQPTSVDDPLRTAFAARVAASKPPQQHGRNRRRRLIIAAAATAAAGIVAAGLVVLDPFGDSVGRVPSQDQLALLDTGDNHLTAALTVNGNPDGVVYAHGAVWVAEPSSDAIVRMPADGKGVRDTINVGVEPTAIAALGALLWVARPAP